MASVNEEIASLIQILRRQWIEPQRPKWKFVPRFVCALLGSLTVFVVAIPMRMSTDIQYIIFDPAFSNLAIPLIPFNRLCTWLRSREFATRC